MFFYVIEDATSNDLDAIGITATIWSPLNNILWQQDLFTIKLP